MPANHPLLGKTRSSTASFTRPADTTAYAANDAVNDSTSAPTALTFSKIVDAPGGQGYIVGAKMVTESDTVANGNFRLYLFNASPTMRNDNSAYGLLYSERASLIGFVDLVLETEDTTVGDASIAFDTVSRIPFQAAADSVALYGLLMVNAAYAPASAQKFAITIWTECN